MCAPASAPLGATGWIGPGGRPVASGVTADRRRPGRGLSSSISGQRCSHSVAHPCHEQSLRHPGLLQLLASAGRACGRSRISCRGRFQQRDSQDERQEPADSEAIKPRGAVLSGGTCFLRPRLRLPIVTLDSNFPNVPHLLARTYPRARGCARAVEWRRDAGAARRRGTAAEADSLTQRIPCWRPSRPGLYRVRPRSTGPPDPRPAPRRRRSSSGCCALWPRSCATATRCSTARQRTTGAPSTQDSTGDIVDDNPVDDTGSHVLAPSHLLRTPSSTTRLLRPDRRVGRYSCRLQKMSAYQPMAESMPLMLREEAFHLPSGSGADAPLGPPPPRWGRPSSPWTCCQRTINKGPPLGLKRKHGTDKQGKCVEGSSICSHERGGGSNFRLAS